MNEDRRSFILKSGAGLGGFLASPRMAVLGALSLLAGSTEMKNSNAAASNPVLWRKRRLLRSGEPLNTAGQPLGYGVSGIAVVSLPDAVPGHRVAVILTHEKGRAQGDQSFLKSDVGISVVELERQPKGWAHVIASAHNRRWDATTSIPLVGTRLVTEKPSITHQQMTVGSFGVSCIRPLPWGTVLCGEGRFESRFGGGSSKESHGWVIEVNPRTGHAVKWLSLGRTSPVSIAVQAVSGQPVTVYMLGNQGHLFKFVSHQRFDGHQPMSYHSTLAIGELFILENQVWRSLTAGLSEEQWLKTVSDPYSVEPFSQPQSESATALGLTQRGEQLSAPAPESQCDPAEAFVVNDEVDGSVLSVLEISFSK